MYYIFCIHSSVEGHLGSFQLLAIINKAAMNIVEHVSFLQVGTSSGYTQYTQERYCGILRQYYVQFFEEPPDWFPEWLYKLAIPPTMEECFSFSTSLPASAVTWIFHLSHSDWYEVESRGASQPFDIPQLRILCLALYPIFNKVIWFSGI